MPLVYKLRLVVLKLKVAPVIFIPDWGPWKSETPLVYHVKYCVSDEDSEIQAQNEIRAREDQDFSVSWDDGSAQVSQGTNKFGMSNLKKFMLKFLCICV